MSIEAAFLLLAAKRRQLSGHELALAKDDKTSLLHFEPGDHVFRCNRASTVALGAWQQECDKKRSHWRIDRFGITMTTGYMRFRDGPWGSEATSLDRLAAATAG